MKVRLLCICAAAFSALGLLPIAVHGAQSGLAYDEVTKIIIGQSAPEPGSFSADFQAAVDAQRSVAGGGSHRGLFGGILNAVDMAKNSFNMLKTGSALSKYYLAGWERTDDVGSQTATIHKPSQHQVIFLDLAKKTYRIAETNMQLSAIPSPLERARNPSGEAAQPGGGRLSISVSTEPLGSQLIENVPTTGYRTAFSMVQSQSTGSCVDGTFQVSVVEYVSRYAEPRVVSVRSRPQRAPLLHPESLALKPGCAPTIATHLSGGSEAPSDRLAMWVLVTINGAAPSAQGLMRGGFSTLIERGNVHALGPSDKSLFDIPAGFTREP